VAFSAAVGWLAFSLARALSPQHLVNAAPGGAFDYRGGVAWGNCQTLRRKQIAHARLIDGVYGADLQSPYGPCQRGQRPCRVYAPGFYAGKKLGSACQWCRMNGRPQDFKLPERPSKPRPPKPNKEARNVRRALGRASSCGRPMGERVEGRVGLGAVIQ